MYACIVRDLDGIERSMADQAPDVLQDASTDTASHFNRSEGLRIAFMRQKSPCSIGGQVDLRDQVHACQEAGRRPHFDFPISSTAKFVYIRYVDGHSWCSLFVHFALRTAFVQALDFSTDHVHSIYSRLRTDGLVHSIVNVTDHFASTALHRWQSAKHSMLCERNTCTRARRR